MDDAKSVFAGLAGARLLEERVELGSGVTLSKTYAHVMAPWMMAFAPAPPGQHHPAPWKALRSGSSVFDIHVQLEVTSTFQPGSGSTRVGVSWFLTALLRLHSDLPLQVPVIADHPFSVLSKIPESEVRLVETLPRTRQNKSTSEAVITSETLDWLRASWPAAVSLQDRDATFAAVFESVDLAPVVRPGRVCQVVEKQRRIIRARDYAAS
jgi:hypothetical protein